MIIQYKCPSCGADMNFDSKSGNLSCDSCGHQDNIADFEEELIVKTYSGEEAVEYQCENCGAVVTTEPDTTATQCSFCDAAVLNFHSHYPLQVSHNIFGHLQQRRLRYRQFRFQPCHTILCYPIVQC